MNDARVRLITWEPKLKDDGTPMAMPGHTVAIGIHRSYLTGDGWHETGLSLDMARALFRELAVVLIKADLQPIPEARDAPAPLTDAERAALVAVATPPAEAPAEAPKMTLYEWAAAAGFDPVMLSDRDVQAWENGVDPRKYEG
jgi:hypothetical protein